MIHQTQPVILWHDAIEKARPGWLTEAKGSVRGRNVLTPSLL